VNPLDLGVIAVLGLSAIFAFARGFVREALSIAAWVGAGFITLYSYPTVETIVEPMVHNPLLSGLIGIAGTFIVSLVALTVVTGIVARTVRSSGLSPIDRTLGFVFGLLRGILLVCLALLALDIMVPQPTDRPPWLRDAKSVPYLEQGANLIRGFLPEQWRVKSAASEDALPPVTPGMQTDKAIKAYVNPATPPAAAPEQPTYKSGDQKQLDRLINNQR
jgi:membrane protein required for colicin V production